MPHLRLYCYFLSPVAVAGSLSLIRWSTPQGLPYVVLRLRESIGRTLHILASPLGSMWSRQCSFLGRVMAINCLNVKKIMARGIYYLKLVFYFRFSEIENVLEHYH